VRENSGVLADRLYQPADDDHRLAVDLDFNTLENPEAFERFLRANVWSSPEASLALAGEAATQILHKAS